jgi:hypothetical protein
MPTRACLGAIGRSTRSWRATWREDRLVPWPPRRCRREDGRRRRPPAGPALKASVEKVLTTLRVMRKVPKSDKAINAHSVMAVADSEILANLWQATSSEGPGDALWLVELRGFEPLTSCMPSRDPGKSSIMKPRITSRHTEAVVVTRGVLRGLVWLELLPCCCPPNDRELHVPRQGLGKVALCRKCDVP